MKSTCTITTAHGAKWEHLQTVDLARAVYRRFGYDMGAAAAAWRRLMQNSTTVDEFRGLVEYHTHTVSCEGDCQNARHEVVK